MEITPTENGTRPVGIWLRVSTEDQAKGESPEHHEKRARLYATSRGWEVKEVYHLEGVSGKSVADHPECKRMLEDVKRGHIHALIFSKLARLARNTRELLDFADVFRQYHADLVSLQESIDTSTPAGRLFYTMIAAMAQWEREEIGERIKASVSIRAKLGKPLNAKAPFGYCYKGKKLVPDPKEAPIRKRMYELFLETGRVRTTARLLNDAGYRTRGGGRFDYSTVKRLIRNPTAKGVQIINFSKYAGRNKSWTLKPQSEWVEIEVDPIIPREMWEQANSILVERQKAYKRSGRPPAQLFSGLTFCHCGQRMYPRVNTPKYVCSRCKNKIPIETLEAIFYEQLKGFFLSKAEVSAHLERATATIADKERHLSAHQKGLGQVAEEIKRIYDLYVGKQLDAEGFGRFYKPLEQRRKQLEDEEPRLQAELDVLKVNHLSADEIVNEACDLYGRWPHLSFEEKRRIVESVTEKIVIGKDDVSISLCHLPSYEEMTKKHRMLRPATPGCSAARRI
jgi:site-specific DNA recombinase